MVSGKFDAIFVYLAKNGLAARPAPCPPQFPTGGEISPKPSASG